jgi:hypothetical protein
MYYLENKPQWLSHCAIWRSPSALWQRHSATAAYFPNNTVRSLQMLQKPSPAQPQCHNLTVTVTPLKPRALPSHPLFPPPHFSHAILRVIPRLPTFCLPTRYSTMIELQSMTPSGSPCRCHRSFSTGSISPSSPSIFDIPANSATPAQDHSASTPISKRRLTPELNVSPKRDLSTLENVPSVYPVG